MHDFSGILIKRDAVVAVSPATEHDKWTHWIFLTSGRTVGIVSTDKEIREWLGVESNGKK